GELVPVNEGGTDYYRYTDPGARLRRFFRVSDGRLARLEVPAQQTTVTIEYDPSTGMPTDVADDSGAWAWAITPDPADPDRIGTIVSADATWVFTYSNQLLTGVTVDGSQWRSYQYDGEDRLYEVADGEGYAVVTHEYSPTTGRAISSQTSDEHVTNIQYDVLSSQLPRPLNFAAGEYAARVTWASGRFTDYYIRPVGAAPHRVVEIRGDCGCPGGGEYTAFALDGSGRVVREQDAMGYITVWDYDGENRVQRVERGHKRDDCDPAEYPDDPAACRLTADELGGAALSADGPLSATDYTYDAVWTNKPASVCSSSVVEPGQQACGVYSYDPQTGAVLASSREGYAWNHDLGASEWQTRTTSRELYSGAEGAVFDPTAFHSEIQFQQGWVTLAQPEGLVKEINGPLGTAGSDPDVTQLVYYPDAAPAHLRRRLAARKDPAGDPTFSGDDLVTVFDDYDLLGNPIRVIDPRGVITDVVYDELGRLRSTTLLANCDPAFGFDEDPLCAQNLQTQYEYEGTTPRVSSVTRPSGLTTKSSYDSPWGRLVWSERGTSKETKEKIGYGREPGTGAVTSEALFGQPGGLWTVESSKSYEYNAAGRLERVIRPAVESDPVPAVEEYHYDPMGRTVTFKDGVHDDANVEFAYDPLGRLTEVRQLADNDDKEARWVSTSYGYDTRGNLVSVEDANYSTTDYSVDDFRNTFRITSPVTGVTSLTYDDAGRLMTREDARGAVETRTYDSSGNL
ncbi:MAG: RHS repeat domain-containing protein, partial [Gemmatimonadota bacterium]